MKRVDSKSNAKEALTRLQLVAPLAVIVRHELREFVVGQGDATRRVKRWTGGAMILRWVAAAVIERSPSFRRLRGYRGLPVDFLRRNDARIHAGVDHESEVA